MTLLPAQKNLKTSELSLITTQLGICTRDATYQMRERAKVSATMALPLYNSERILQEVKHCETTSLQGFQLVASKSPKPMKTQRAFTISHDLSMATGRSKGPLQKPNQRPLYLLEYA